MSDTAEWHTFSGRTHKFGALQEPRSRSGWAYRVALCNGSIYADEWTQHAVEATSRCKRCFPATAAVSS